MTDEAASLEYLDDLLDDAETAWETGRDRSDYVKNLIVDLQQRLADQSPIQPID